MCSSFDSSSSGVFWFYFLSCPRFNKLRLQWAGRWSHNNLSQRLWIVYLSLLWNTVVEHFLVHLIELSNEKYEYEEVHVKLCQLMNPNYPLHYNYKRHGKQHFKSMPVQWYRYAWHDYRFPRQRLKSRSIIPQQCAWVGWWLKDHKILICNGAFGYYSSLK